jgi:catechol 2,3-dioxygenase-like lactoylglutathione lyase family enzyme
MLDHVTIGVSDTERSKQFYDRALRPLGIMRLYADGERFAGYGISPKAFFWIGGRDVPQTGAHVAFAAPDRATVDRFFMAPSSSIPTATISRPFAACRKGNTRNMFLLRR